VVGGIPEAVTLQAIWFKADKATGELVMKRDDLARYLGTSPSSLGRYLLALSNLGVLSYDGRRRVGYDKTTKYTVHPDALDALVQKAATPLAAPVQDAPTASAESSGFQVENVQDAPTRMSAPQSVKVTHSQSVKVTHSSTKNEEPPPPTPSRAALADDLRFSELWGRYPATEWKAKTNRTALRGFWFSLTDRQRELTFQALDAYLASSLWEDPSAIPGPKLWLENEPWTEVEYGNLPEPRPRIQWTDLSTIRLED
jgi:hypothetical protein